MRITGFVLADEDVSAPGPVVETGASGPGQREVNQLRCRALIRLRRLAALKGHRTPAQGATLGINPKNKTAF
jgi:hypothetical protein